MSPGIQTFCTHAQTHAHTLVEAFSPGPSGHPGNSGSFWCSEQNHKHGTDAWSSRFALDVSGYFAFLSFAPVKESFSFLLKPTAPDDSAFRCCSVRLSIDFSPSRQPLSKAALINTFTMEQMRATHIIELCTQLIYLSG